MRWEQFRLDNGLQVVFQPDPNEKEVSIEFWVRVGSRNEEPGKFGLAHFAEHATPYGFPNDTAKLARFRSQRKGSNAQTRKDYTRYYIQMPSEALELGLQYSADRLSADTLFITDRMIEQQGANVLAEIERNSVNAFWGYLPVNVREAGTFGAAHPYGHSGYGTPRENEQFTVHDVRSWYSRYISPRNAILFVVGGFDANEARKLVQEIFGRLPGGKLPPAIPTPILNQSSAQTTMSSPSREHVLSLTWALPTESASDDASLNLLAHVLDAQLADSTKLPASVNEAGSSYLLNRYQFAGQFGVYAKFTSQVDSAAIEARLNTVLNDVLRSRITNDELGQARQAELDRISEMMTNLGFMDSRTELLGEGLLFFGNPQRYMDILKQQSSLTAKEIQAAARKWLGERPFRLMAISSIR